jgi:predicted nucleic acid-binding protein
MGSSKNTKILSGFGYQGDAVVVKKNGQPLHIAEVDPDDDMFVECAVEGKVDYLVSGNDHLFALKEYEGIQILTPTQFLMVLQRDARKKAA